MTVSTATNRNEFVAAGGVEHFDYTFQCVDQTHIVIYMGGVLQHLTADYTVDLVLKRVTPVNPPGFTVGADVIIMRIVPLTQLVDYTPHDPFPAETHEAALDKLTMEIQQGMEAFERCLSIPAESLGSGLLPTDLIPDYFVQVNAGGTGFELEAVVPAGVDLSPYAMLGGRAAGQTLQGGVAANEDLILESTHHGTKGFTIIRDGLVFDVRDYASINAAVTAIGATPATLVVSNAQTITADLTIPTTLGLKILNGGSIVKAGAWVLAINGPFEAGPYQVFTTFAAADINFGPSSIKEVHPEWFPGANLGVKVNFAFDTLPAGGKIILPMGTQTYTTDIYVPRNDQFYILEGQGIFATILNYTGAGIGIDAAGGTVSPNLVRFSGRDFKLVGTGAATNGISLNASYMSDLQNVWVTGFTVGSGLVMVEGAWGEQHTVHFFNTHLVGNKYGLTLTNINAVNYFGGSIEANTTYHMILTGAGNVNFYGTTIEGATTATVANFIQGNSTLVNFYSCWFEEDVAQFPVWITNGQANFDHCYLVSDNPAAVTYVNQDGAPTGISVLRGCQFIGTVANPIAISSTGVSGYLNEIDCTYTFVTANKSLNGSIAWDPGNLVDGAGETSASITVTGGALGDFVLISAPYDLQGITCNGYVDAANSVKIRLQNETTGAINLANGTWRVRVIK